MESFIEIGKTNFSNTQQVVLGWNEKKVRLIDGSLSHKPVRYSKSIL